MLRTTGFVLCSNLKSEVLAAVNTLDYKSRETCRFFSCQCHPNSFKKDNLNSLVASFDEDISHITVFGGCCISKLSSENVRFYPLNNCFDLLIPCDSLDHFISEGYYILTPGWLNNSRENLKRMGLNKQNGREFFNESCKSFLLLDTGVDVNPNNTI